MGLMNRVSGDDVPQPGNLRAKRTIDMNYISRDRLPEGQGYDDAPVGIVALWQLLWQNKLRILAPAFVLSFIVGALMIRGADTYTAEAQMLLSRGNLEIVELNSVTATEVTQGALTNALTILGSRSLALQVIERLDLYSDPEVNPNLALPADADPAERLPETALRQFALDWLAGVTQVTVLPGSNAISIRATTTVPQKSAAIANAYVDAYLDYQIQRGQNETERAAGALETRVNALRLQLEEDRARLQAYRAEAPSTALAASDSLAGEVDNIRARLSEAEEDASALTAAITALDVVPGGDFAALQAALDAHAPLRRLAQSVLRRPVQPETVETDIPTLATALAAEEIRLERLQAALREGRDTIQSRIAEINAFTVGLRQLEVEVDTTSQVYESALARLKELAVQTGLRDAGAQVLARAEAPLRTDAQGRRRMVAIAGVLGLFIGIAYVLLREAANDRVRKVSDLVEITGCDTVVQLPSAHPGLFETPKKMAPFLEGIRALRHRLTTANPPVPDPLVAGVFSSFPTEGKTTVLRALAQSFSMIDKRIVVIDADMRVGQLSHEIGVAKDSPGLSEVLSENLDPSQAIIGLNEAGFDLMPSGQPNMNSADLLESKRFAELVAALRERYDVILFETPPVLLLPDAPKIAAHMDTAVIVTEYDRTPRPAIRDAMAALKAAKANFPVVTLCNAPKAFGQNYWIPKHAASKYWG